MLRGKNFVCIGNNMWQSNFTNTLVEMMTVLSSENKILYVDYEFSFKDIYETLRGKKNAPIKRIIGLQPRLREVTTRLNTSVYVLTPPAVLPINRIQSHSNFKKLLSFNASIVEKEIRAACKKLNIIDPIVVSGFNPYYGSMLHGKLNEILHIYYCYDEIDAGWHKLHGPEIEKEYLKKADLTITTSDYLHSKKSLVSLNCHLIKNGVDFEAFNKFAGKSSTDRKVIGYTGSIDTRFDTETVEHLISHLPEIEFHFAGRVTNKHAYEKLKNFDNIKLLGSKKPEEIPSIVGNIDLGIVPYLKNDFTKGVYPLKFNEYLAAGKPVVSTDFSNLPEFDGLISFASSKEEFLRFVLKALKDDNEAHKEERIKFAKRNSWTKRAESFSTIIERKLVKRNKSHLMTTLEKQTSPLVSIITVNYNNAEITCDLIESLKKISYPNIEIIVVDNASAKSPDMIKERYPEVTLIKNSVNKGFAGGNNDGLKAAKGKYLFMLNNDTEVPKDFLEPLVTLMEADATIGALSPKICYYHTPEVIQFAGGDGINTYTGRGKFTGKGEKDNGQYNHCREIVHAHGAAMLISRKAMEDTGMLYEDYFLYYEELDYCEQIKRAGYKIWYAGSSMVYHKESASVGKENPMKLYYLTRNRLLYMERNVKGLPFLLSMLFFFCFSIPKHSLTFITRNKIDSLKAYYKGISSYLLREVGKQ